MLKSQLPSAAPDDIDWPMEVHRLTLTFTGKCAALEKPFLNDYVRKSLPQMRIALILGIAFYALFGILDAIVAPDLKFHLWLIRFAAVCPMFAAIYLFSYSRHSLKYIQGLILTAALIAGLGIVYMILIGNALIAGTYYAGLMLVLMMMYSFGLARFVWAALSGWIIVIVYTAAAAWKSELPIEILANNAFFCISANLIGMAVCYTFEYFSRRDFYMRRLLDEQHQKLAGAKDALEERVSERTRLLARTNDELRREVEAHQRLNWEKQILEDQLRQAQKIEAIGTLAGGIAHDFNNIIAAILGHCELALMQLSDPREAEICLAEVLNASHRAKDLVGQILAFSRQSESELKPLKISMAVKEAMRLLKATLPSTISIQIQISASQSIVVADVTQIHQIVINLCTNAAHAMEPQGGTLMVTLDDMDIEQEQLSDLGYPTRLEVGKYVCLCVSDTGHGIPEHLMDRIFDPYFTTKAKGVGTGLGLAVVRGIVENHGGLIEARSKVHQGTTFMVYLPRVQGRDLPELHQLQMLAQGNERILLVDDEEGLAELGAKLLTALGYRVTAYTSSEDALMAFHDHRDDFDLLITDMVMPKMNGETLAREILSLRADMPVIVYTGFTDQVSAEKIKQMGVRVVLRKPITIYSLSQAIRKVIMEQSSGPQQTS
jgi:signal transduction histidine kinase/ActR/RegA family two-component response regulator